MTRHRQDDLMCLSHKESSSRSLLRQLPAGEVRKAVTLVVGDWLLHLRDRYSYFHKLIPLLLSSLSDDVPEIKALAWELWRQVGTQWEKENEDDLKDKMDFALSTPFLYPPGGERPGLGCRELVVRNLSRLLPAIRRDVGDWLAPTRVKTARLLTVLLLHAEDHSTQHLQPLLATLYQACADPEPHVRAHVRRLDPVKRVGVGHLKGSHAIGWSLTVEASLGEHHGRSRIHFDSRRFAKQHQVHTIPAQGVSECLESARLLGVFVSPEVYLKLLLAHVENPSCSSSSWTPLAVLAAVLRGSSREALRPHLLQAGDTLALPDVCQESQQLPDHPLGSALVSQSWRCPAAAFLPSPPVSSSLQSTDLAERWMGHSDRCDEGGERASEGSAVLRSMTGFNTGEKNPAGKESSGTCSLTVLLEACGTARIRTGVGALGLTSELLGVAFMAVYVEQLLACVEAIVQLCEEDCHVISLQLLKVLVTVQSVATEQALRTKAEECVTCVYRVLGLSSVYELYRQHMAHLLQWLSESLHSCSAYSIQKTQLETIAFQSGVCFTVVLSKSTYRNDHESLETCSRSVKTTGTCAKMSNGLFRMSHDLVALPRSLTGPCGVVSVVCIVRLCVVCYVWGVSPGPVVGEFLPELLPLLRKCLEPGRDPEVHLAIFTMLSKLLLNSRGTLDSHGPFPPLSWQTGMTLRSGRPSASPVPADDLTVPAGSIVWASQAFPTGLLALACALQRSVAPLAQRRQQDGLMTALPRHGGRGWGREERAGARPLQKPCGPCRPPPPRLPFMWVLPNPKVKEESSEVEDSRTHAHNRMPVPLAEGLYRGAGRFQEYVEVFLQELLLPHLVWRAGRTAAAVRTAALSCVLALLQGGAVSSEQALREGAELSARLLSALEEESQLSRVFACRALHSLINLTAAFLQPDALNKIYPELLKRIDDSSEEVRIEALKALSVWFSCLGKHYETHTYRPHLEFLFQQLLLYLDDPDQKVQLIVLEVLKTGSGVDPVLLQKEVEVVRDKQRRTEHCDHLLQHIQSLTHPATDKQERI
ncbi:hypothetical protein P4O66_007427 [Electrophorus voltai]|uniref:TOG domain-containing protein n=1 Tax=Electrophorus voltai TaxID=2609070 RepID=A0AAD8ZHP7_9TELE|nr:hypothetical protein P4O66_007427 [Electrophorus voltai]